MGGEGPPSAAPGEANPFVGFASNVRSAWNESFMAEFDDAAIAALLEDAREVRLEAGEVFYRGTHHADMVTLALVISGLLRTAVADHQGREMTLRYATEGAVVGLPAVILAGAPPAGERADPLWLQVGGGSVSGEALQRSYVLKLSPARFRRMVSEQAAIAWPLVRYVARETLAIQQLLAEGVFLPVRARVARHLLDLAQRDGRNLMVRATHQEIANAIGTVREVVSRVLRSLQAEGQVLREGNDLILVDAAALHAMAVGGRPRLEPRPGADAAHER